MGKARAPAAGWIGDSGSGGGGGGGGAEVEPSASAGSAATLAGLAGVSGPAAMLAAGAAGAAAMLAARAARAAAREQSVRPGDHDGRGARRVPRREATTTAQRTRQRQLTATAWWDHGGQVDSFLLPTEQSRCHAQFFRKATWSCHCQLKKHYCMFS